MFKESAELELKKSLSQLKEGIISMSSMLNVNNKGIVIFGINDNGKVFGVDIGKKTKQDIAHEIQNNLKPLPSLIKIEEKRNEDSNTISIYVEGNDTPYSAYGRYYLRLNDSDVLMQPHELRHFFENKKDTYSDWEQKETNFTSEDVDEDLLIECIRNANDKGRMNYIYRNADEALTKLNLLTKDGYLNNAGLYLFGKCKPLTIKEATFPTDTRTEFGEIKQFKGNIFECINESILYIQNHISYKSIFVGIKREEKPEIPLKAIREIIVNSFAHCSYAMKGDCNTYSVFKSSITAYNPGSIFENIDPMRFASGKVGSKVRNIIIAQILFYSLYIDAFGTGFDRTFTLCSNEGVKCEYENNEYGFIFRFKRNPKIISNNFNGSLKYGTLNDTLKLETSKSFGNNKIITDNEINENLIQFDTLNDTLKDDTLNPGVNNIINANKNNNENDDFNILNDTIKNDTLKNGIGILNGNGIPNNASNDLDNKILKLMTMNKFITINEISKITNISISTIKRRIRILVDCKIIKRIGSKKYGCWIIN